jgi:hypothetical protein
MTDAHALLARHSPRLVYDSQEAYFADSAATWTDSRFNVLRRADGTLLAKPPQLALGYLGAHTYSDGKPVLGDDTIGETTKDYAKHAAALHAQPGYRNRIHARARRDSQGRLWLQYWFFYYYNDFQLVAFLSGGKHEGDWEMIQIRLDANEKPVEAVFAQHTGAERQDWSVVRKPAGAPDTPLVYVARGSHASYFRAGDHWTGVWWDHADGKGPTIAPALVELDPVPGWAAWPGFWGDTKATPSPLDSSSPRGPVGHAQWGNPGVLVDTARRTAAMLAAAPPRAVPRAPTVSARREGTGLVVAYDTAGAPPAALVVATRPAGSQAPATTYPVEITAPSGEFELPDAARDDQPLEVSLSTAQPGGVSSPARTTRVDP